jgi:hypothetical protein
MLWFKLKPWLEKKPMLFAGPPSVTFARFLLNMALDGFLKI